MDWKELFKKKPDKTVGKSQPTEAASLAVDPESKRLWNALRDQGESFCCHMMQQCFRAGITHLTLSWNGRVYHKITINYCPECGRKL